MNPTVSAESHFSGMSQNLKTAAIFRQPAASAQPLLRLNAEMDETIIPYEVNEGQIESWLTALETAGAMASPIYWLLLIRLNGSCASVCRKLCGQLRIFRCRGSIGKSAGNTGAFERCPAPGTQMAAWASERSIPEKRSLAKIHDRNIQK